MNLHLNLPKPQEALEALGLPSLAAVYQRGPEFYADEARKAQQQGKLLRAVNLYVCAAQVSAGQCRSQMYEDEARTVLRSLQGFPTADPRKVVVEITNENGEPSRLVLRPSERPLGHWEVFWDGGVLADGRDYATWASFPRACRAFERELSAATASLY